MSFPRYPEYRDSGVEWLGEVPAHWETHRVGALFAERRAKVSDTEFAPLSVTKEGIVPQLETAAKTDDNENRKLVCAGDFVINSRSDRNGSAGLSPGDGSVSLINTVLQPSAGVYGRFVHYLLRSALFQQEFYRRGKGIVADLWSTNYAEMKVIPLPLPTFTEQLTIASFLDQQAANIDSFIAEQERLIELLKEKLQATITRAVTKGLDPDTPMKRSGVEWLGDVPAHWCVTRVKHLLLSLEQGWSPQCEAVPADLGEEWGVLKVGCVNGGEFNAGENKLLPSHETPMESLSLKAGDILVSRANTRELVGGAALIMQDWPKLLLCDKLYRLRANPNLCQPEYLVACLHSAVVRGRIELAATGASASMVNIPQSAVLDLAVAVPRLKEQTLICDMLADVKKQSRLLTGKAERAIALLRERRAALISAAVTGKIDVRNLTSPAPVPA